MLSVFQFIPIPIETRFMNSILKPDENLVCTLSFISVSFIYKCRGCINYTAFF
jgi:hypothetical protein